jgi:myo-inositol-1(or 4)-monophosphatase
MKYSTIIEKAIRVATFYHRNQNRKYPGDFEIMPYICHPFAVAMILSNYTDNENIIVAGILHDIIEDTKYTQEQLEKDFGEKIKNIVMTVTETKYDEKGNKREWKIRKDEYINNVKNGGFEAMMVCAADKIHNFFSVINYTDKEKYNEILIKSFNFLNLGDKFWFQGEILKILKEKLDNPIVKQYEDIYQKALEYFK